MKIKEGNWVRVSGRFETFITKYRKGLEEELNNPSIEPWKPQEGEWFVPLYQSGGSFSVLKWEKRFKDTAYELCEPFLGELPDSVKEREK